MISLTDCQPRLARLAPLLVEGTLAGAERWQELVEKQPDLAKPLGSTARANYIHAHGCHEIAQRVEGVVGVTVSKSLLFFALAIDSDLLLRFKYLNQGRPSNFPTDRQKLLAEQHYDEEMMLELEADGFTFPPTLLTLGYTLDDEQEIGRIEIRRDCKGHPPWHYNIYSAIGEEVLVEPIPFPGMIDNARPARVTSKEKKTLRVVAEDDSSDQG